MTPDLFGARPKTGRRVMMHAVDHGQAPGLMPGWRTAKGGLFECSRCGMNIDDLRPNDEAGGQS